jgi:hypothetical protein
LFIQGKSKKLTLFFHPFVGQTREKNCLKNQNGFPFVPKHTKTYLLPMLVRGVGFRV